MNTVWQSVLQSRPFAFNLRLWSTGSHFCDIPEKQTSINIPLNINNKFQVFVQALNVSKGKTLQAKNCILLIKLSLIIIGSYPTDRLKNLGDVVIPGLGFSVRAKSVLTALYLSNKPNSDMSQ